jgi:hypothetical protein
MPGHRVRSDEGRGRSEGGGRQGVFLLVVTRCR